MRSEGKHWNGREGKGRAAKKSPHTHTSKEMCLRVESATPGNEEKIQTGQPTNQNRVLGSNKCPLLTDSKVAGELD